MGKNQSDYERLVASPGWVVAIEVHHRREAGRRPDGEVVFDVRSTSMALPVLADLLRGLTAVLTAAEKISDLEYEVCGLEPVDPSFAGVAVFVRTSAGREPGAKVVTRVGQALCDALETLADEIEAHGQRDLPTPTPAASCKWLGNREGLSDRWRPMAIAAFRDLPAQIRRPGADALPLIVRGVPPHETGRSEMLVQGEMFAIDVSARRVRVNGSVLDPTETQFEQHGKRRHFECELDPSVACKSIRGLLGEAVMATVVSIDEIIRAGQPKHRFEVKKVVLL